MNEQRAKVNLGKKTMLEIVGRTIYVIFPPKKLDLYA